MCPGVSTDGGATDPHPRFPTAPPFCGSWAVACLKDDAGFGWRGARGGYNSDDITKVGVGGGVLSQEAVMTE